MANKLLSTNVLVLSVSYLPELKQSIPSPRDKVIHAEALRGISFPDVKGKVELLIGADVLEAHRTLEYRINSFEGPNVVKTRWAYHSHAAR